MKTQLEKMNFNEFKDHLDNENILYEENNFDDFGSKMIKISPKSENYKSRNFRIDNGKQEKEYKNPKIKTKLDALNYTKYIEYLNNKNIKYEELRDWDFFILDYILVTPNSRKLKSRTFSANCGSQVFEGDYVEI